ncbi:MAG TPA: hypothetical protein VLM91_03325, partial [Candidatus Methylomirabilis sp.]|nr:hypothetical protein [Candidatus Methylomirabilis sp.]
MGVTLAPNRRSQGLRGSRASRSVLVGSSRGIIYPILLLSILVIGIATAGVSEVWSTQVKREKEEELLYRLGEFRQAILRYKTDHNRLPMELKDLLE